MVNRIYKLLYSVVGTEKHGNSFVSRMHVVTAYVNNISLGMMIIIGKNHTPLPQ